MPSPKPGERWLGRHQFATFEERQWGLARKRLRKWRGELIRATTPERYFLAAAKIEKEELLLEQLHPVMRAMGHIVISLDRIRPQEPPEITSDWQPPVDAVSEDRTFSSLFTPESRPAA